MQQIYTYLALGDSYTIGESVLLQKSFPYQTVQLLRKQGHHFAAPEIIARTGWTTDELEEGIKDHKFLGKYDFVSLLIGVNNQYRGRDVMVFKMEFEELLKKSIIMAGNKASRVIVLPIPDYSVTPFAASGNVEKTAKDIEVFNNIINAVSIQYKVHFSDIPTGFKNAKDDPALIATDGLHPSPKEYKKWAQKIAAIMEQQLK
ncbi:MAG: SGNH/GDSL hydrolase family protein [Flavisolibacter sp.]